VNKSTDIISFVTPPVDRKELLKEAHVTRKKVITEQLDRKNVTLRNTTFAVGDLVLRKIIAKTADGSKHALDTKYAGPFRITALGAHHADLLPVGDNYSGRTMVHLDHLKPFHTLTQPQVSEGWSDNIAHKLNLSRRPTANMLQLLFGVLLFLPLMSTAPVPPLTPYHYDTNVVHRGGLLYAQTPQSIRIAQESLSLTQPIELQDLAHDATAWKSTLLRAKQDIETSHKSANATIMDKTKYLEPFLIRHHLDTLALKIEETTKELSLLNSDYSQKQSDLLQTYSQAVPHDTSDTYVPFRTKRFAGVLKLLPLLKAAKPLSLLSKASTVATIGHLGYSAVENLIQTSHKTDKSSSATPCVKSGTSYCLQSPASGDAVFLPQICPET
jgi:hypothetical protein